MSKKRWIFVKRGLSQDPKHREAMGGRVWVYLHMVDRADWETGVVHGWRDKDEADDMGMPLRTLRTQRQELAALGYITCRKRKHAQDIVIHNWVNPRTYSGVVLNAQVDPKESDGDPGTLDGESAAESTPQSAAQSSKEVGTPSIKDQESLNQESLKPPRPRDLVFEALADITDMTPPGRAWKNLTRSAAGQLNRYGKELREAGANPDQVLGFGVWWRKEDWRGRKGQPPTPADVVKNWPQFLNAQVGDGYDNAQNSGGSAKTARRAEPDAAQYQQDLALKAQRDAAEAAAVSG